MKYYMKYDLCERMVLMCPCNCRMSSSVFVSVRLHLLHLSTCELLGKYACECQSSCLLVHSCVLVRGWKGRE